MTSPLLEAVTLGQAVARNRVLFGPHVTNLGDDDRALTEGHVAYYARRARGGCGTIVTEVASVHASDWPYERSPLASACGPGWAATAAACRPLGSLVLAGLGHAGMQGSTAWSQDVLWAPSLVANVMTREQPVVMGGHELAALVEGFASSAAIARRSGCDGVEVNAGQHSLVRQFCSGLTNLRDDAYGEDRALLLREVVAAVRAAIGDGVLGVRFSADELAPWAGLTAEEGARLLATACAGVDYVCVVRGSIYSEAATQPDGHVAQGFNEDAMRTVVAALAATPTVVCAQGSVVDVAVAERLVASGASLVEMTRAQIADPDLCEKLDAGAASRIRPCLLCNQHCAVRDPRNPIVSCTVNPVAGHELDDADLDVEGAAVTGGERGRAVVVGAGVAGLEAARLLARRGHAVTVLERDDAVGGALRVAAALPGRSRLGALAAWLVAELAVEGVEVRTGVDASPGDLDDGALVLVATGGTPVRLALRDGDDGSVPRADATDVAGGRPAPGRVVVLDTVGGPIGVGVAELAASGGASVTLVTPDVVAGSQLSLAGDLVAANERLARLGVVVVPHAVAVAIRDGEVVVEDRFTAAARGLAADLCVEAAHRVPRDNALWPSSVVTIGDAVAPRGLQAAMLDARRAVVSAGPRP